ncbi:hypothetical protein MCOR27_003440 [Pyricularia oryzae]|nr:hypothetical protein MCOR01_009098 [Pyricularia oryzae]KAI6270474.1 hypothetical protein MCOR26_008214 [Pyricularia oryzae]KAI6283088.1 hypothetical protein MCOR27_003440 [Pyricularia oryzae]KAI6332934.1 hypothetical protein MCOR30_004326 [Pyricularia oryzae]
MVLQDKPYYSRICLAVGSYDGSIADAISSKDSSGSFAPFSTFLVTRPDRCVRRGMFSRRKLVQPRGQTIGYRVRSDRARPTGGGTAKTRSTDSTG